MLNTLALLHLGLCLVAMTIEQLKSDLECITGKRTIEATQTMVQVNTLNKGLYKVTCNAGPAFANRQEAGLAAMLEYAAIDPTIVQTGGDLMLKSINAPLVDEMAARKRMQLLQAGMIPQEQMTDEELAAQQQAAQEPQQEDPMVMLERMKEETLQMVQQNKATEHQINIAKATTDAELKTASIQSGIMKDARTLEQNQEKIDNDKADKDYKNSLALAELEPQAQKDLNAELMNNMAMNQQVQ